jgi:hypothetical protein
MLLNVLHNRNFPRSDINPRNQLRDIIFGHRCSDRDVLKQELPCIDQDLMPIYVQDSRLQAHFNVWSNMFLHLLEQIGYY